MTTEKANTDITSSTSTAIAPTGRRTPLFRSDPSTVVPIVPMHSAPIRKIEDDTRYDFVALGESIAAGMIEAAERQLKTAVAERDATRITADRLHERMIEVADGSVTQAQNSLAETKAFADDLRARIEGKNNELAEMNERLKTFGLSIKEAHEKFHGSRKAERRTERTDAAVTAEMLKTIEDAVVFGDPRQK